MADVEVGTSSGFAKFAPTTVQALNVSYTVNGKQLLRGINATFPPATMSALMGPSGAGKTTLMNVLSGRVSGTVEGQVLINGRAVTAEENRKLLTLMPQADIVHGALTVEECVKYAARIRCPASWTDAQKMAAAERIMETLGMMRVRNNVIGDEHHHGISGGQRKRVSAAIEFLACRPVLFMDEPTSGLDSATAKALMVHLAGVARQEGRTVIAVVHQPAWTIMSLFETLILLGKGGRTCFRGTPDGVPSYFAEQGAPCPATENPADHMLYVLSDGDTSERWASKWLTYEQSTKGLAVEEIEAGDLALDVAEPSFMELYMTLTKRTIHVYLKDPSQAKTQFTLMTGSLIFIGLQLLDSGYTVSKANGIYFITILLYLLTTLLVCTVMPLERAVVLREYRNGMYNALAYWLARLTLAIVVSAVQAFWSQLIIYPMLQLPDHPSSKIIKWYFATFFYLIACNIWGMLLGIVLPSVMLSIKAVPGLMTFWILGSGAIPPINRMRPALAWLRVISPMGYCVKIYLITAFKNGQDQAYKILTDSDYFAINTGNEASCFLGLFLCCVVLGCLGFAATSARLAKVDSAAGSRAAPTPTPQLAQEAENPATVAMEERESLIPKDKGAYGSSKDPFHPPAQAAAPGQQRVTIQVRRLTFIPEGSDNKTLNEVTATFAAGTVTALMGPSGAGKSTLLNVILGRAPGSITGDIHANGHPCDPAALRMFATLTPQDDNLLPDLTVRQTLHFTARLRCTGDLTRAEKIAKADAVISDLGLDESADVIVGSALKPGISGGQKKRLSIGMDLLAQRPIMFLDEPTTGLDANAALTVMQMVQRLSAGTHRTLVATIHQPQWAVLSQFDQLVLIAAGKNIYSGNPATVPDFFAAGGRPRDANENPADHMMFALTEDGADKWVAQWVLQGSRYKPEDPLDNLALAPTGGTYAASPFEQYLILLERITYSFLMDEDQGVEYIMAPVGISIIIGSAFYNMGKDLWLASGIFLAAQATYNVCMVGTVLQIPMERALILREFRNGAFCGEAYWAARVTLCIVASTLVGLLQTPIWWTLIDLPQRNLHHAQLIQAMTCTFYSIAGSVVGLLARDPINASQWTGPVMDSIVTFSGVFIPKRHIKSYFEWLFSAMPSRYAIETIISLSFEDQGDKAEGVLEYFDFHPSHAAYFHRVLFIFLICVILLGFIAVPYRLALK